jgi:hypothetical protein
MGQNSFAEDELQATIISRMIHLVVIAAISILGVACGSRDSDRASETMAYSVEAVRHAFEATGLDIVADQYGAGDTELAAVLVPRVDPNPNPQFEVNVFRDLSAARRHGAGSEELTEQRDRNEITFILLNVTVVYHVRTRPARLEHVREALGVLRGRA